MFSSMKGWRRKSLKVPKLFFIIVRTTGFAASTPHHQVHIKTKIYKNEHQTNSTLTTIHLKLQFFKVKNYYN